MKSNVANKSPLLLLCVEDDLTTSAFVCTMLRMKFPDVQIHTAENGKEGLARYLELRPDLVVTDIRMPVMDGIAMAREIRRLDSDLQIIVTTAENGIDHFNALIEIGINRYVVKPIDMAELIRAIEECIAAIMVEVNEQHNFIHKPSEAWLSSALRGQH